MKSSSDSQLWFADFFTNPIYSLLPHSILFYVNNASTILCDKGRFSFILNAGKEIWAIYFSAVF